MSSIQSCGTKGPDLDGFPSTVISNDEVEMKIYLPDPENGLYRATRFDWSGVIGSVTYRDHEYFGYWKETHDPLFHEDLTGPVEGYLAPGPGYEEAAPGEHFIRIGVGVLEKEEEEEYNWMGTYKIADHGTWKVDQGEDWIKFTHEITTDFGYAYVYQKTIRLTKEGFTIGHVLLNKGEKIIETDQFNHNFFMIDGEPSGKAFSLSFPFEVSTQDDSNGILSTEGNTLKFNEDLVDNHVFVVLEGYDGTPEHHQVTVQNNKSGAGVTFTVDQPLHRLVFWACETTLSPENFIWISVRPGNSMEWNAEYQLFEIDPA